MNDENSCLYHLEMFDFFIYRKNREKFFKREFIKTASLWNVKIEKIRLIVVNIFL